jgi:UDPglucose 6-dehydrogenase
MREAPSRALMEAIWAAGGKVRAYDPIAMEATRRIYGERPDLVLTDSAEAACEGADVLALVTEWAQFRSPDFGAIKSRLKHPAIFDGRNLYDPALLATLGFHYQGIGRRSV